MNLPHKRSVLSLILLSAIATAVSAEDSVELTEIEVIGTTPLHGVGLPADQIATNVQSATAADIENTQSLDISDFMNNTLSSVSINSAQNSPFQPDLQFRGFTASPLIGNSQGLSVYIDGVRVNEPFGDAVNFELIPQSVISSMNLMPGSNPIFGLNTLGGAISIQTKNGFTDAGHSIEAYGGSFGRWSTTLESGGSDGNLAYYVSGTHTEEDGWRDESDAEIDQLFAKLSYQNDTSTLDFSLMGVDSDLNGNGASPVELVKLDREAVFTHPDNTQNELRMMSLNGSHWLNDSLLLSANTYFRNNDRETFNGDGAELEFDGAGDLVEEGDVEKLEDVNGNIINEADLGNPDDDDLALNNTSTTEQDSYGLSLQFTFLNELFDRENQFIVGASYDKSDVEYVANSEVAVFNEGRGTNGTGVLLAETAVDGKIDTKTFGLFFTDTISMTDKFALTVAARYNRTEIDISGTSENGETNLNENNEKHVFNRINPSIGFTYAMSETTGIYAGYNEANRAPTPSELTCADPAHPCALPNSFLSDPPLDDVVAKTFEAGVRGVMGNTNWSFGFFNTTLKDDILFFPDSDAPAGQLNVGIFDNVDRTKRQGFEFGLSGKRENLTWSANYSIIDATYESSFGYIDHEGDPQRVTSGNSIPGIPKNNIKIGLDYDFTPAFSLGMNASYHSGQYFRGDDVNEDDKLSGYGVVNLHSRYKFNRNFEIFAKVDNLFDSEYNTFGLYGEPDEAPGLGALSDEHFVGTSAPRAGWIGVKLSM